MKYFFASLLLPLSLSTHASCVIQATTGDDIKAAPMMFDREIGPVRVYSGHVLDLQVLVFINPTEESANGTVTTGDGDVLSRFETHAKKIEELDGKGVQQDDVAYRFQCEGTEI